MKRFRRVLIACMFLCALLCTCTAEEEDIIISEIQEEDAIAVEEKALQELQPMLENDNPDEIEGMDLEALSDRYLNEYTKEYVDGKTGFSFLYPVCFQFDENAGNIAYDENKTAKLTVTIVPLDEPMDIEEAENVLVNSGFSVVSIEENKCIRAEKVDEDGKTDVQICKVTEQNLYIVEMVYPADQKDKYAVYVEYLINSMTADDTELG